MKCCICQKGMQQGVTLYRVNAKGVAGIWVCEKHLKQTDAPPVHPDVAEIVDAINGKTEEELPQ